jgi:hypothetical protein
VYEVDALPGDETKTFHYASDGSSEGHSTDDTTVGSLDRGGSSPSLLTSQVEGNKAASDDNLSFLALLQRKIEFNKRPFLFPWYQRVFGTPLLIRVPRLAGFTGRDIYDLVAVKLRNFVPASVLPFVSLNLEDNEQGATILTPKISQHCSASRMHIEKSTIDMEETLIGDKSRYGFVLRICCRDGTRCSRCPWFASCIGCLVHDDDSPSNIFCGDSIAIDWQLIVDLSTSSFEEISDSNPATAWDHTIHVKRSRSGKASKGRDMYRASIKLEDCLDAFAQKERIPEVRIFHTQWRTFE